MTGICEILSNAETIAVVGLSRNRDKTSRVIARYLENSGFKVVGVNPDNSFTDADGIKVYNRLTDIPVKIDIVDVFRKSEDIPNIVSDILEADPKVLWLQLGIRNDKAVDPVKMKGITVIQDRCIKIEHNNCS